jgi:alkylhydroperoxidase family enzyme
LTHNSELVAGLSNGHDWRGLAAAKRTLVSYARQLTATPVLISASDITALRVAAFSDRAVLEINLVTSYMNFVNRIAQGLGVDSEPSLSAFSR